MAGNLHANLTTTHLPGTGHQSGHQPPQPLPVRSRTANFSNNVLDITGLHQIRQAPRMAACIMYIIPDLWSDHLRGKVNDALCRLVLALP